MVFSSVFRFLSRLGRRVAARKSGSDDEASGVHELFRSEKSREVLREFPEMGVPQAIGSMYAIYGNNYHQYIPQC